VGIFIIRSRSFGQREDISETTSVDRSGPIPVPMAKFPDVLIKFPDVSIKFPVRAEKFPVIGFREFSHKSTCFQYVRGG
jgi:hypothetical protein